MTTTPAATTEQRLNVGRVLPKAYKAMDDLHEAAAEHLEAGLVDLVCLRTAQLNGCAFCLDMHSKDALHHGDTSDRLFMLGAWHEAPSFTPRERAALALTDAVTMLHESARESRVSGEVWEEAATEFEEQELAALLALIVSSNGWNRLSIAVRLPAGRYHAR
jgi:AhpD family alkylhydroperoxidase